MRVRTILISVVGVAATLAFLPTGALGQSAPLIETSASRVASPTDAAIILKKGTRQLNSRELKKLLSGVEIQKVVPPELTWLIPPERFLSNGDYILFEHRRKEAGRYSIERNAVCVTFENTANSCRYIFLDLNRRYWISKTKSPNDLVHVWIEKFVGEPL